MTKSEIKAHLAKHLKMRTRNIHLADDEETNPGEYKGTSVTQGTMTVEGFKYPYTYCIAIVYSRVYRPKSWHDCYYCRLIGDGQHWSPPKAHISYSFDADQFLTDWLT